MIAREKFSITNQDYSNAINIKELKEHKNMKQKEENSDSSVDVEKLFEGFNVGEKRENNESPSNCSPKKKHCSPKKKQATALTTKTSQHLEKSKDNVSHQDEFDEMSFNESQDIEIHKQCIKDMEDFRKNVENQQSSMLEQRNLKEIEKVIFSSGLLYLTFYGHLTLLLLNK